MSKEQEIINAFAERYLNHPYMQEYIQKQMADFICYGSIYWNPEEAEAIIKKIEIENEVAKYFRAN